MGEERKAAAAGRFYAGNETSLRNQIEECFKSRHGPGSIPQVSDGPRKILGLISPHAGYPYSGPIAAHGFFNLAKDGIRERIVILGPNHSGLGRDVAIDNSNLWRTPLGTVKIDKDFARELAERSDVVEFDSNAHHSEHSLEVQLPFLQYLFDGEFKIVPICIGRQTMDVSRELGESLGEMADENTLVIASSDFTHYEPIDSAKAKDKKAIERIEKMDWKGFLNLVSKENLSICGYSPIAVLMKAVEKMNGEKTKLFKYATSGDTAGSPGQVVGYCSLGFLK
ncbi:MAG: AmmeMemoRadiSam system protein B [Candidatus Hadarchaeia archaeon]